MKFKTTRVDKPWGHELIFALAPKKYAGKILVIEKGKRLSLQYHRRKHESLYVLKGKLTLRLGKKTHVAGPGTAFAVPTGTVHRFESHHGRVTLVEVSTTELDDVVRLQDDYGRTRRK
ncbi:MAG TPA: cupin domain-containing protein [Elusimicrobiota bacterium]|nr:cupin domain-containing protein [Elusimicrobiota bacterium]